MALSRDRSDLEESCHLSSSHDSVQQASINVVVSQTLSQILGKVGSGKEENYDSALEKLPSMK